MSKSLAKKILPSSVLDEISRTIEPKLRQRANGEGIVSTKMCRERRQTIFLAIAQLWQLGFQIKKMESLSTKHVDALMAHWHKQGISANTLHTRLSTLRVLCGWLGKTNVVKDINDYVPAEDALRKTAANENLAWEAKEVNPLEIIELAKQVNERLAAMLSLQHHFGLRVKESIEIRPANSLIDGGRTIEISSGTKGGRIRQIRVETREQMEAIAWAYRLAETGNSKRLRWTDCSWIQAQNRFYNLVRKRLGISGKGLGVTSHGLRHGYSQRKYRSESGFPTPIEGGALGEITRDQHRMASTTVSRALGHGRVDVTASYYGTYGHALRQQAPVSMTFKLKLPS
jgi:integrase